MRGLASRAGGYSGGSACADARGAVRAGAAGPCAGIHTTCIHANSLRMCVFLRLCVIVCLCSVGAYAGSCAGIRLFAYV